MEHLEFDKFVNDLNELIQDYNNINHHIDKIKCLSQNNIILENKTIKEVNNIINLNCFFDISEINIIKTKIIDILEEKLNKHKIFIIKAVKEGIKIYE